MKEFKYLKQYILTNTQLKSFQCDRFFEVVPTYFSSLFSLDDLNEFARQFIEEQEQIKKLEVVASESGDEKFISTQPGTLAEKTFSTHYPKSAEINPFLNYFKEIASAVRVDSYTKTDILSDIVCTKIIRSLKIQDTQSLMCIPYSQVLLNQPKHDQPGVLEKLLVNQFRILEPLTLLDMMRLAYRLNTPDAKEDFWQKNPMQTHVILNIWFDILGEKELKFIRSNDAACFFQLQEGEWVYYLYENSEVYASFVLTVSEKQKLKNCFGKNITFVESGCNDRKASGYWAFKFHIDQLSAYTVTNVSRNTDIFSLRSAVFGFFVFPAQSFSLTQAQWRCVESFPLVSVLRARTSHEDMAMWEVAHPELRRRVSGGHIDMADLLFLSKVSALGFFPELMESSGDYRWKSFDIQDCIAKLGQFFSNVCDSNKRLYWWNTLYAFGERFFVSAMLSVMRNREIVVKNNFQLNELEKGALDLHPRYASSMFRKWTPQKKDQKSTLEVGISYLLNYITNMATQKQLLVIFPDAYSLDQYEQRFLVNFIMRNPYVHHIDWHGHKQLTDINNRYLAPAFARNIWLSYNHYRVNSRDDYFYEAARYLVFAFIDDRDKDVHVEQAVCGMENHGLHATLDYLINNAAVLKIIIGKKECTCFLHLVNQQCIDAFQQHIEKGDYFPFSRIRLSLADDLLHDENAALFFKSLLQNKQLKTIELLNVLNKNPQYLHGFLVHLKQLAEQNSWTTIFYIPELELNNIPDDANIQLCINAYSDLDNCILKNCREYNYAALHELINTRQSLMSIVTSLPPNHQLRQENREQEQVSSFPLEKQNFFQLQQQHQQQQLQQLQQELHQQVEATEDPATPILPNELYDYQNIEKFKETEEFQGCITFLKEHFDVQIDSDTNLQLLFEVWIGANPRVNAEHIIQKITPDALEKIINYHMYFQDGINIANLPVGFYTQRNEDHELVLCYDANAGYSTEKTLFTLQLRRLVLRDRWKGDAEQLGENEKRVALFEFLNRFSSHQHKLETYNTFYCRQCVLKRVDVNEQNFRLLVEGSDFFQLFCEHMAPDLKGALENLSLTTHNDLIGLSQVFYHYGASGVILLVEIFNGLDKQDLWRGFKQNFVDVTQNLSILMSPQVFEVLLEMLEYGVDKNFIEVWQHFSSQHIQHVGVFDLHQLWEAFKVFYQQLCEICSFTLTKEHVGNLSIKNMLVWMERILDIVQLIPEQLMQHRFLGRLCDYDLTRGGVYYALAYEGYTLFSKEMKLEQFTGNQTYLPKKLKNYPDLNVDYEWAARTIASQSWVHLHLYDQLIQLPLILNKNVFILLVVLDHTVEDLESLSGYLEKFNDFNDHFVRRLMDCDSNRYSIKPTFRAVQYIFQNLTEASNYTYERARFGTYADFFNIVGRDPILILAEALMLLDQRIDLKSTDFNNMEAVFYSYVKFFEKPFAEQLFKLAILSGIGHEEFQKEMNNWPNNIPSIIAQYLNQYMNYMIHIDFKRCQYQFKFGDNWSVIFRGIVSFINALKVNANVQKLEFKTDSVNGLFNELIQLFKQNGFEFTFDQKNIYRRVAIDEVNMILRRLKIDDERRSMLASFLIQHIVVAVLPDKRIDPALLSLVQFFDYLNKNMKYIDDVSYVIQLIKKGLYLASDLNQLFRTFYNEKIQYPVGFLNVIFQKDYFKAADSIESIQPKFAKDSLLLESLKEIVQLSVVSYDLRCQFAELAIQEYGINKSQSVIQSILKAYSSCPEDLKKVYLNVLISSSVMRDYLDDLNTLLTVPITSHLSEKYQTHIRSVSLLAFQKNNPLIKTLLEKLQKLYANQETIYPIVIRCVLDQGYKSDITYHDDLHWFSDKLIQQLKMMGTPDLDAVLDYVMQDPVPSASDVYAILTSVKKEEAIKDRLNSYTHRDCRRKDHGRITPMRMVDFTRMLQELTAYPQHFSFSQLKKILQQMYRLKYIESGKIDSIFKKPITQMSQKEINDCLHKATDAIEVYALLFEVHYRVTGKYPTLAQQIALIGLEESLDTSWRGLQLGTGEGKTAVIAMRAAFYALYKKKGVTVCTAKRTLAERDEDEYRSFYEYLGLASTYLMPHTSSKTYDQANIVYTTEGDLSLAQAANTFSGQPFVVKPVKLLDEGDYTLCYEEYITQYNFADPSHGAYCKWVWFYDAVNAFYKEWCCAKPTEVCVPQDTDALREILKKAAGYDEIKREYVEDLAEHQLVSWIQSAHIAATKLIEGKHFALRENSISIASESLKVTELVPLSDTNQPIVGSIFSDGVHQLKVALLNKERAEQSQHSSIFCPGEGISLDTQKAVGRTVRDEHVELFSGTITNNQIRVLSQRTPGISVLRMPPNQPTLRIYHDPVLTQNDNQKNQKIVNHLKQCLTENKSVLVMCDDDRSAIALNHYLEKEISDEQRELFVSEQNRGVTDMLDAKKTKEVWKEGKKTKGVALIASSLGRGDHLDVDTVFMLDVVDESNFLQKTGRTARQGSEGEVFEFYNVSELFDEYESLCRAFVQVAQFEKAHLFEQQTFNQFREELLSLRQKLEEKTRYVDYMLQCYLSEYSKWFSEVFSMDDNKKQQGHKIQLWKHQQAHDIKQFKNHLLRVKENHEEVIKQFFIELSEQFEVKEQSFLPMISAKSINTEADVLIDQGAFSIQVQLALHWFSVLAKHVEPVSDELTEQFLEKLEHLTDANLYFMAERIFRSNSPKDIIDDLDFFSAYEEEINDSETGLISCNFPVIKNALASIDLNVHRRYKKAYQTLINYLMHFPVAILSRHGEEFIHKAHHLFVVYDHDVLDQWFKKIPPMSYDDFNRVILFSTYYCNDVMRDQLIAFINKNPTQRLRMFGAFERWSELLDHDSSVSFLQTIMSVWLKSDNHDIWSLTQKLINKTNTVWFYSSEEKRDHIIALWKQWSDRPKFVCHLQLLLKEILSVAGEEWLFYMNRLLDCEDSLIDALVSCSDEFIGFISTLSQSLLEQTYRENLFDLLMDQLKTQELDACKQRLAFVISLDDSVKREVRLLPVFFKELDGMLPSEQSALLKRTRTIHQLSLLTRLMNSLNQALRYFNLDTRSRYQLETFIEMILAQYDHVTENQWGDFNIALLQRGTYFSDLHDQLMELGEKNRLTYISIVVHFPEVDINQLYNDYRGLVLNGNFTLDFFKANYTNTTVKAIAAMLAKSEKELDLTQEQVQWFLEKAVFDQEIILLLQDFIDHMPFVPAFLSVLFSHDIRKQDASILRRIWSAGSYHAATTNTNPEEIFKQCINDLSVQFLERLTQLSASSEERNQLFSDFLCLKQKATKQQFEQWMRYHKDRPINELKWALRDRVYRYLNMERIADENLISVVHQFRRWCVSGVSVEPVFDFSVLVLKQRVALMQLLYEKSLVTTNSEQWETSDNDNVYQQGMNFWREEISNCIPRNVSRQIQDKEKPGLFGENLQIRLFHYAQSMQRVHARAPSDQKTKFLRSHCKDALFQTLEQLRRQLKKCNIKTDLAKILKGLEQEEVSYAKVLKLISKAFNGFLQNTVTPSLFKSGKGYNPQLNILLKMHDAVVQAWLTDDTLPIDQQVEEQRLFNDYLNHYQQFSLTLLNVLKDVIRQSESNDVSDFRSSLISILGEKSEPGFYQKAHNFLGQYSTDDFRAKLSDVGRTLFIYAVRLTNIINDYELTQSNASSLDH